MAWKSVQTLGLALALFVLSAVGIDDDAAPSGCPAGRRSGQYHGDIQAVLGPATHNPIRAMEAAAPSFGAPFLNPIGQEFEWSVECDGSKDDKNCKKAVDRKGDTSWKSKSSETRYHNITIDLREKFNVHALRMVPSPGWRNGGSVAAHRITLSSDGRNWGSSVAFGTWHDDQSPKFAIFEPQTARYVRLEAKSAAQDKLFISIAEVDFWVVPSIRPNDGSLGVWGPTIDFPTVPVGVFIDPFTNIVVSFSSDSHDGGSAPVENTTWTATWEQGSETVSERNVNETQHNMFCPGMAFDVNGSMIITGGGGPSSTKTSTFNARDKTWNSLGTMNSGRGYQGSTTTADGRIFVIGGSWNGPEDEPGPRPAELYDPSRDTWDRLDNCLSERIRSEGDGYPKYRGDNHVWLLGWKDNTVFHAGPAPDMHWINTTVKGGALNPAGVREKQAAMCGIAVMYDAEAGEILTAGGAPQYEYYCRNDHSIPYGKPASRNAFIITLNETNKNATVTPVQKLNKARTFLNAVVLPNGETFVAGGMEKGEPWSDDTAVFTPETWSPVSRTWTPMAPNSIPRTYHSFALLLQDATVLVGGGGLTTSTALSVNHFDAQIYTPPYLLRNGRPRLRPVIIQVEKTVHLGSRLTFTADSEVTDASLIRYGGATHTVNNDQRRIKLKVTPAKDSKIKFQYSVEIPKSAGVAIPGYWMLFVLNKDGTPSVAKTVQVLCHECKVRKPKGGK